MTFLGGGAASYERGTPVVQKGGKAVSRSNKAGPLFPVGRVHRYRGTSLIRNCTPPKTTAGP